jgi:secondary thiamine-phosphate synthase enzyme
MDTHFSTQTIKTKGFGECQDITETVQESIIKSGLKSGVVTVSVPGSTASITTIEYEPGVVEDLKQTLERIAPSNIPYRHNQAWHDGNGFAHVRAALLKPSLSIPFNKGKLVLGAWQQIVLLDFDNRPRQRKFAVMVVGH